MNPTRIKRLLAIREESEYRFESLCQEIKPLCLLLAEAHGITTARNFSDPELSVEGDALRIKWTEWWQSDPYDWPVLRLPLHYLELTPKEFQARIEEIKAASYAESPRLEEIKKTTARMAEDERRAYQRLKAKYEPSAL